MAAEKKLLGKKGLNKNDVWFEYYAVDTMTKCVVFKL
jgi:hypothetical protein